MAKQAGKVNRLRELREARASEIEATPFERHSRKVRDAIHRGRVAFEDLGAALRACKDSGSWREKYTSWTDACEAEWGISRRHANRLIEGVRIMDLIGAGPVGPTSKNQDEVDGPKSLPANERAVRELGTVPDENKPEVAKRASEIAGGADTTAADIRLAKRDVLPESEPEPEPEHEEPDPWTEVARLEKENGRLEEVLEQIQTSDLAVEVATWSRRYAQLEARLNDQARLASEAQKTATYAQGQLRKIREALGVERDRDILPAIRGLVP
jgi:hypothetical protein